MQTDLRESLSDLMGSSGYSSDINAMACAKDRA